MKSLPYIHTKLFLTEKIGSFMARTQDGREQKGGGSARQRHKSFDKHYHYSRKDLEMFKKQKSGILALCIVAFLVISLAITLTEMELDIDWTGITSYKEYRDDVPRDTEPGEFDNWAHVIDADTLHRIDITKPCAFSPFMTMYEASNLSWWDKWCPSFVIEHPSRSALRAVCSEGFCTLDFHSIGGGLSKNLSFDYSSLANEPTGAADFIYPSMNDKSGISINLTLMLSISPGAGDALMMVLENLVYRDVPVSISSILRTPGFILAGREHEPDIPVININYCGAGTAFPTMTDYTGDTSSYSLMTEYPNEINFSTTPVPGALVLGGVGIGVVGWLRRRRTI